MGRKTGTTNSSLLGVEANVRAALGTTFSESVLVLQKDAAELLKRNVPGISTEPRAPLFNDPILRGRRLGQSGAKGSYWFPARQDLDTALSKFDPRVIEDIRVFKGPYSALYGPSLSFYDVELYDAPRYDWLTPSDFQHSGMSVLEYETNGEQWHGRQAFWGGTSDWGYRVGYSHRTGNDYETGAGAKLPSSYKSREFDLALGANLTTNSKIDFHYLRLDQTDVEFPLQFFADINGLETDGFTATFQIEEQQGFDRLELEGWYNQTRFDGDNLRAGRRRVLPLEISGVIELVGSTAVSAYSTGYRLALEWGDRSTGILTAGTDLRYLSQQLDEFNQITVFGLTFSDSAQIPKSQSSNPGVFLEYDSSISSRWTIRSGGRLDWVSLNADSVSDGEEIVAILGAPVDQHFSLGSAYLTSEFHVNTCRTVNLGIGYAMRSPTMTEMYSSNPSIGVLPQIIRTPVFGNPLLDPEKLWQVTSGSSKITVIGGMGFRVTIRGSKTISRSISSNRWIRCTPT